MSENSFRKKIKKVDTDTDEWVIIIKFKNWNFIIIVPSFD